MISRLAIIVWLRLQKGAGMPNHSFAYACGCAGVVYLQGPRRAREARVSFYEGRKCPNCYRHDKAAALNAEGTQAGLPALEGSDKQILWATKIRLDVLGRLGKVIAQGKAESSSLSPAAQEALTSLESARSRRLEWTSAHRWISSVDVTIEDIARGFAE